MAGCCDPGGYRSVFGPGEARRSLNSFRRKGLDSTARPMVEALRPGITGATLLEVGAGTGAAEIELLQAGAEMATWVDISPDYMDAAHDLASEAGVHDRIERHVGDFVGMAGDIDSADVVFLNRVVCCYPDMPALVIAVAGHSLDRIALSYPRDRWWVRLGAGALNRFLRWRKVSFQVFIHDPAAIDGHLRTAGYEPSETGHTPVWHWSIWKRSEPASGD